MGSLSGHGLREDFSHCTADTLDYVRARFGISDPQLRNSLLDAYWRLDAYPEVRKMLTALRRGRHRFAILSNGTPAMLEDACAAANLTQLIDAIISIERARIFKPPQGLCLGPT